MKRCKICGREFPDEMFLKTTSYCPECRREYMKQYMRKRRSQNIGEITENPCHGCEFEKGSGCKCKKFKQWFKFEWQEIQIAAADYRKQRKYRRQK